MDSLCVIFDIDGTLVDSHHFEGRLYWTAVREALGDIEIRDSWHTYEHITDAGILQEVCRDNQLELMGVEAKVRACFGNLVSDHLCRPDSCRAIAGGLAFWKALRANPALELGIATGGWGHTARMKLDSAGYEYAGISVATSDDNHERTKIMNHCRSRLPVTTSTIYIGDGEWDRIASERLGWRFIGVGERLRGKCVEWVPDFQSGGVIEELIAFR